MNFHLLSFILGIIIGVVLRELVFQLNNYVRYNKKAEIILPISSNIVAFMVTMVWVLSMLVEILNIGDYSTSPLVHGLMGGIVGFYFKPLMGGNKK